MGDIGYLYSAFKLHRDSSHLIENLRSVEKIMILNVDFILSKLFSWLEYTRKKDNTNILYLQITVENTVRMIHYYLRTLLIYLF